MEWLMRLPLDFITYLHILGFWRGAPLLHAEHPGLAGVIPFMYAGIGFMIVAGLIGLAICHFLEHKQAAVQTESVEER